MKANENSLLSQTVAQKGIAFLNCLWGSRKRSHFRTPGYYCKANKLYNNSKERTVFTPLSSSTAESFTRSPGSTSTTVSKAAQSTL